MAVPDWIWFVFTFAFGCCIGSFLNVVIYRLPRDKSLVTPPSACPACGKHIPFYDNIPLFSWLFLGRKCRYCKVSISPRYFIIELLTGLVFLGLFILYFQFNLRDGIRLDAGGGWFIYVIHIIMLGAFIAASAIDLELWIIPLSICWVVTAAGFIGSAVGVYIIDPALIHAYSLLPSASANTGALAVGATAGLVISLVLLVSGVLKRSYDSEDSEDLQSPIPENLKEPDDSTEESKEPVEEQFNHRLEACREIVFLLPIIVCSVAGLWIVREVAPVAAWWDKFSQIPAIAGLLGSVWGYFVGCGIVWCIRIFGTLGFGKEAMGLGDVHLMGAAGAVIGPVYVVVAFFVAPFFGLTWAGFQMFFKKIKQIPYGPFLSLGIFVVIILHDWIRDYVSFVFDH
ncbi:MAG: prepilin peptidase [Planctomycetes bacterium]|nr:prepilin peptidase [Planctomycetota bacterium]MBL7142708.1 prepilin peptidase [Phycisphaerae bacterium]